MLHVMRALEARRRKGISDGMANCTAVLLNRCEVGKDGRTRAFEGQEGQADHGTRCLGKWSKRRQGSIVAQHVAQVIEVDADSKHRLLVMEHFGLEEESNISTALAIKEDVGRKRR